MVNKHALILLTFLIFLFVSFACAPTIQALEYFGYYNLNGLPPDTTDHIPSVGSRENSNIGHIIIADTSKLPQYLTEMRQNKIKAILGVRWIFNNSATWQQSWQNLRQTLKGYEDVVYGFYFDEPVWTGVDVTSFREYTRQIRTDYPDKAVIVIEAYLPIENNSVSGNYLEFVTDYGFDLYPSLFTLQEGGFDAAWARYLADFDQVKTLAAGKKLWLIPDGWNNGGISTDWLGIALNRYYELAKATPAVTGLLVFRYDPGDETGGTYYTIQDVLNPNSRFYNAGVLSLHQQIGKEIISAPTCKEVKPDTPTTTSTSGNFIAYAMGVENATAVDFYVWSDAQGINSYTHYPGTNLNFGTWRTTIDLANHPGIGKINVRVYMNVSASDPNGILCGTTPFERLNPLSPGDLTGDGHVNLLDYKELVAGFGTRYTIFDYSAIVANYGK